MNSKGDDTTVPPEKTVYGSTSREPTLNPGSKPKLISPDAGLVAVAPSGDAVLSRLKPKRKEFNHWGLKTWVHSTATVWRLLLFWMSLLFISSGSVWWELSYRYVPKIRSFSENV